MTQRLSLLLKRLVGERIEQVLAINAEKIRICKVPEGEFDVRLTLTRLGHDVSWTKA